MLQCIRPISLSSRILVTYCKGIPRVLDRVCVGHLLTQPLSSSAVLLQNLCTHPLPDVFRPQFLPCPVGGIPAHIDLAPACVFLALYIALPPLVVYRAASKKCRGSVVIAVYFHVVERVAFFALRLANALGSPAQSTTTSIVRYTQSSLSGGSLNLLNDIIHIVLVLLMRSTIDDTSASSHVTPPTIGDQEAVADKPEEGKEAAATITVLASPFAGENRARERRWYRRLCISALVLTGVVANPLGIASGALYVDSIRSASVATAVSLVRYVCPMPAPLRRALKQEPNCRYISSAVALFLAIAINAGAFWAGYRGAPAARGSAWLASAMTTVAMVVIVYRLVVMRCETTALLSTAPGSLNGASSKATFYVFHMAPEWVCSVLLLSVNMRARFGPGGLRRTGSGDPLLSLSAVDILPVNGPMFRLTLGGKNVVVLNSGAAADELLSKRSAIYSSRPASIFAGKYESQGRRLVLLPYGVALKRQRAAFHQMLQTRVVGAYEHYQDAGSLKLLYELLTRPDDVFLNVHRFAASLVFRLTYGRVLEEDDKDLKEVVQVIDNFVLHVAPGAHLVDALPILDWLPDWMSPWRAKALRMHEREMRLYQRLADEVKGRLDAEDSECFAAKLWEQQQKLELDDMSVAYLGGTSFEAGTSTTSDSILWFLAAVLLNPASIKPAQAELDIVVGDHLPTFGDFETLSYCTCMTKELLRWAPVIPGGIAHVGVLSPVLKPLLTLRRCSRKTTISRDTPLRRTQYCCLIFGECITMKSISLMRKILIQSASCPQIHRVSRRSIPCRKVAVVAADIGRSALGEGRDITGSLCSVLTSLVRICPGRHLASKSVWLAITRIAWAFDIVPVLDMEGNPILPDRRKCTAGLTVYAYFFCTCLDRSVTQLAARPNTSQ
ncbi:hypothetical protein A0H81_13116 [Grifola frondosa]|uniref:Cytochrome P450 n=1 Tax=Grifola frondosa TaxID=5627 RepID=A0A1C7LPR9_GRIFR|nr:hypothetical protein A0H81_13116 [Grifola frondosa]